MNFEDGHQQMDVRRRRSGCVDTAIARLARTIQREGCARPEASGHVRFAMALRERSPHDLHAVMRAVRLPMTDMVGTK